MLAWLVDPFQAGYMQRALVEVTLLGILSGVVGVYVLLRRLAFVSDALTHTVFPGVAIAYTLGQSLFAGALVAGALSAMLLTLLASNRRVGADSALAILLVSFFAVGVVVVSRSRSYTSDLTVFLFGRLLAVDAGDVAETAVVAAIVLVACAALHKELVLRAFDPAAAEAMGYPTLLLDLALNAAIALVVVAAVKAVGTVLVIALIVTPAAAARLLSGRIGTVMIISCVAGVASGWVGLVVSYEGAVQYGLRLASGATIVLVVTLLFLGSFAASAPRLVRSARARRAWRVAEGATPRG